MITHVSSAPALGARVVSDHNSIHPIRLKRHQSTMAFQVFALFTWTGHVSIGEQIRGRRNI
jgi:hypothetical protein